MVDTLAHLRVWLVVAATAACCNLAQASQFSYLDAAYQQEIYTGPLVGGPGMAWTAGGNLLTRDGSSLLEYSPTSNATYLGNSIHTAIATHTISGMVGASVSSIGIVNGTDGYLYATSPGGLQRIDPTTWTATTVANVAGHYGITVLPDGRIVYVGGGGVNEIWVYNPAGGSNTMIYTASGLIDDIQASPTGVIALAGQGNNEIVMISDTGSVLLTVTNAVTLAASAGTVGNSFPDGLAFGYGAAANKLFSNDNMGTITEYDFNVGYTSLVLAKTIASGGSYGDLAAVGPDCSLYVSQFYNGGYHGSALFGTNWNAGTNNDPSIVRISSKDGSCVFAGTPGGTVAEPGGAPLVLSALALLAAGRRFPGRRKAGPASGFTS